MKPEKNLSCKEIIGLLKENRRILKRYKVRKIGCFGSYARGEQRKDSDVDFLVEFEEPSFDSFMDLSSYLEDLLKKKVDLVTFGSLSPYMRPYAEKEVVWI